MRKARSYLVLRISATRFAYEVFFHFPSLTHFYKKSVWQSATGFTQKRHTLYAYYSGFAEDFKCFFLIFICLSIFAFCVSEMKYVCI